MENSKKKSSLSAIKTLLAAFLMTGLLIYSYKYLPKRELVVIPGNDLVTFYLDSIGSQFLWIDQSKRKFRCTFHEPDTAYKFCGIDIRQGDGLGNGVDLSVYDEMELQITYTGEAGIIRFFIRNFSPSFSTLEKAQTTSKYINSLIPVSEIRDRLTINVKELTIPEWWIRSSGIPRELSYTEINNVVHLGIDVPYPAPYGNHDLELKSLRLTGLYISKDGWYLIILGLWGMILFIIAVKRDLALQQEAHLNIQSLEKEKVKSKHLKQVSEKYRELAILDSLTGVFNRRGIYQFYDNCFANNSQAKGAIIMLDIDHFKPINDTYGHDIGDSVLHVIGSILRNSVREQDSVGRWGGEEFIILCINTDLSGATFLAEKIRTDVEAHVFTQTPNLNITISLGVGLINPNLRFEENVKNTDIAMYKAKQSGRNRWVTAHETTEA